MAEEKTYTRNGSGMKRGTKILLVASLALNVAVIGIVAGGIMRGKAPGPFGVEMSLGPYARALDREDREALKDEMRNNPSLRPPRSKDRIEAVNGFAAALKAEPFDRIAVQTMFDNQRTWACGTMEAGQTAMLNRITNMTSEERVAFADRILDVDRHFDQEDDH